MKFLAIDAVTAAGTLAREHRVTGVSFSTAGIVIDVEHMTGDDINLRVGISRYTARFTDLDLSLGDPAAAATIWLASDGGPMSGAAVHDVDEVAATRITKAAEVMAAHAAAVIAAGMAADLALQQVDAATEMTDLDRIDPQAIIVAAGGATP